MPGRLFLIHWQADEAAALARPLCDAGWQVEIECEDGARACRRLLASPPDVVVVYLTRLPSHGRVTIAHLRTRPAGQALPVLFVGGQRDALAKVRAAVPDAEFLAASELPAALERFGAAKGAGEGGAQS